MINKQQIIMASFILMIITMPLLLNYPNTKGALMIGDLEEDDWFRWETYYHSDWYPSVNKDILSQIIIALIGSETLYLRYEDNEEEMTQTTKPEETLEYLPFGSTEQPTSIPLAPDIIIGICIITTNWEEHVNQWEHGNDFQVTDRAVTHLSRYIFKGIAREVYIFEGEYIGEVSGEIFTGSLRAVYTASRGFLLKYSFNFQGIATGQSLELSMNLFDSSKPIGQSKYSIIMIVLLSILGIIVIVGITFATIIGIRKTIAKRKRQPSLKKKRKRRIFRKKEPKIFDEEEYEQEVRAVREGREELDDDYADLDYEKRGKKRKSKTKERGEREEPKDLGPAPSILGASSKMRGYDTRRTCQFCGNKLNDDQDVCPLCGGKN